MAKIFQFVFVILGSFFFHIFGRGKFFVLWWKYRSLFSGGNLVSSPRSGRVSRAFAITRVEDSRSENVTCNGRSERINNSRVISRIIIRYRVIYQTPYSLDTTNEQGYINFCVPIFAGTLRCTKAFHKVTHVTPTSRLWYLDNYIYKYTHTHPFP